MDLINVVISGVIALITGSVGGVIVSWVLGKKEKRFNENFERKMEKYVSMITYCEVYLNPEESKHAAKNLGWDARIISNEENKIRAYQCLKVLRSQIIFLCKNESLLMMKYDAFLSEANEGNYQQLVLAMKNDLWKI